MRRFSWPWRGLSRRILLAVCIALTFITVATQAVSCGDDLRPPPVFDDGGGGGKDVGAETGADSTASDGAAPDSGGGADGGATG